MFLLTSLWRWFTWKKVSLHFSRSYNHFKQLVFDVHSKRILWLFHDIFKKSKTLKSSFHTLFCFFLCLTAGRTTCCADMKKENLHALYGCTVSITRPFIFVRGKEKKSKFLKTLTSQRELFACTFLFYFWTCWCFVCFFLPPFNIL